MRLTILNVAFPFARVSPDPVGGAEQVLAQLDRALVAAGHRSIVVASAGLGLASSHCPYAIIEPTTVGHAAPVFFRAGAAPVGAAGVALPVVTGPGLTELEMTGVAALAVVAAQPASPARAAIPAAATRAGRGVMAVISADGSPA